MTNRFAQKLAIVSVVILSLTAAVYMPTISWAGAGEDLYKSKCAMCHGPDGTGNTAMGKKLNIRNLLAPEVQKMTDAQMFEVILNGKNKMPTNKGKLKNEEVNLLVSTIRTMAKK